MERQFPKEDRLRAIYAVVGSGMSDIGKGWLAASIGAVDPSAVLPIKIDPLLNVEFPDDLGVEIRQVCHDAVVREFVRKVPGKSPRSRISDDFRVYRDAGLPVYPECNIVAGDLMRRFVATPPPEIRRGEVKKQTLADLSRLLAETIRDIVRSRNPEVVIIEIGGTIEDHETVHVPAALRFLGRQDMLGIVPQIVLLSYFEYAEGIAYRIKTQYVRRGLRQLSRSYYGLPLAACFARRRNVPDDVTDDVLRAELTNVAHETQVDPTRLFLLPNVPRPGRDTLTPIVKATGVFDLGGTPGSNKPQVLLCSACLLDIPCRYDGKLAPDRLDLSRVDQTAYSLVPICPEQLSGLPTPRAQLEIEGGDGYDVLHGRARVVTQGGEDFSDVFIRGARISLEIAKAVGARKMITQKGSPSCSCSSIYDGTFSNKLREGTGVCAAFLGANGVQVMDVAEWTRRQDR